MTTADDPFFDIVNNLEIEDDVKNVVDVSKLTTFDLLSKFDDINNQLFELNQAINPTTQTARDLHSLRSAIYVEIQNRKKS